MRSNNLELLASIEKCLEGMTLWSETEAPYKVFIWEVAEKGEFSIEALLLSLGYLTPVDHQNIFADVEERLSSIEENEMIAHNRKHSFVYGPEAENTKELFKDVIEDSEFNRRHFLLDESEPTLFRETILGRLTGIRQKYQAIARSLEPHLSNLQIYRLSTSDLDFQRFYDVYLIIGQTQEGHWIGFSTEIAYSNLVTECVSLPLTSGRETISVSASNQRIISAFEQAIQDFVFPTIAPYYSFEIDKPSYPFEKFVWELADTKSKVVAQLLESINFLQVKALDDTGDYYSSIGIYLDERGQYQIDEPFQKATVLIELLKSRLREQKAYWFGLCEMDLYIVGATPTDDLVCISSLVVHT